MTEEPEPQGSSCAGVLALVVLVGGATAAVFAVAPALGLGLVWIGGAVWLWRTVRSTANPAPPAPSEGDENAEPQFSVVEDEENPHRSHVVWTTEGETDGTELEA